MRGDSSGGGCREEPSAGLGVTLCNCGRASGSRESLQTGSAQKAGAVLRSGTPAPLLQRGTGRMRWGLRRASGTGGLSSELRHGRRAAACRRAVTLFRSHSIIISG